MSYQISTSRFSFIQFAETDVIESCNWPDSDMCLPVFADNDVYFQFFINSDTEEEADALCDLENDLIRIGLVEQCTDGFLLEFSQKPVRYRISDTQVLYVWQHGLPNFTNVLAVSECFHIRVQLFEQAWCSNCFQRIGDDCHTSVLEYYGEENQFGYAYCPSSDGIVGVDTTCEPTIIQFTNQTTMVIPWTAFLQAKYGDAPTVAAWVNDGGELVQAGIRIAYDAFPMSEIRIDFGGLASGIVRLSP